MYFVHDIKPEDYLATEQNIFDYCGGVKIKGNWEFVEHQVLNGDYAKTNLQDTLRYYISSSGSKIIKCNRGDNREIQIEAGRWLQTVYVKHVEKPFDEYGINLRYYLDKINKEIQSLEPVINQLKLFQLCQRKLASVAKHI